jgi:hypothetical protein
MKCTATTRKGDPCHVWAVRGTDPPRCFAHFDGRADQRKSAKEKDPLPPVEPGPPPKNLDDLVSDMGRKLAALSALIDREFDAPQGTADLKLLCRLLTIYNQAATNHARLITQAERERSQRESARRLGKIMRDRAQERMQPHYLQQNVRTLPGASRDP